MNQKLMDSFEKIWPRIFFAIFEKKNLHRSPGPMGCKYLDNIFMIIFEKFNKTIILIEEIRC